MIIKKKVAKVALQRPNINPCRVRNDRRTHKRRKVAIQHYWQMHWKSWAIFWISWTQCRIKIQQIEVALWVHLQLSENVWENFRICDETIEIDKAKAWWFQK